MIAPMYLFMQFISVVNSCDAYCKTSYFYVIKLICDVVDVDRLDAADNLELMDVTDTSCCPTDLYNWHLVALG